MFWSNWFSRRHRERDLQEEIDSHLRMAESDYTARGAASEEAKYAARREMGNAGLIRDAARQQWGANWLEQVREDVRFALRIFRKNPGFAMIAIVTLGLGIAVSTSMFTLLDAVLFSGAPYPKASRLIALHQSLPELGEVSLGASVAEFLDYKNRNRSCQSMTGFEEWDYDLTGSGPPERITAVRATGDLFVTLGVRPVLGRAFSQPEDVYGARRVAVLSYGFWQTHFGGEASVLGRTIRLDERSYTVIGVMPRGFEFPSQRTSLESPPAAWMPMQFSPEEVRDRAGSYDVSVIARLKVGVTVEQAQQDMSRVTAEFTREHPDVYTGNVKTRARVEQLGATEAARERPALIVLAIAVLLVLLIACANVANLLLAKGGIRQREIAVRSALGASGRRLTQQLLTESIVLSLCGAVFGCGLAQAIVLLTPKFSPPQLVALEGLHLNTKVLAFTLLLSILTGIACGVAPAIQLAVGHVSSGLKESGRSVSSSRGANRIRRALVIAEAALAVILLIGAALLIRSFERLLAVPPGFDPQGVALIRTSFNRERYAKDEQRRQAEREILGRLRAMPGVTVAALTTHLPLADEREIGFVVEGRDPNEYHWADNALVDAAYFQAMRIPLVAGRTFGEQDTPNAPVASVINETMARQFWPRGDAIGKRVTWYGRHLTITGIARDVKVSALDASPRPMIYNSVFQVTSGATSSAVFVIRSSRHVESLLRDARKIVWSVDGSLPVFAAADMETVVVRSLGERQFSMVLLSVFAALAMGMAAVGLYSVLSQAVVQRRQEIGIRLALGAPPGRLIRLILREGMGLTLAGVALGAAGGMILSLAMSKLLFGIRSLDALSFAAAVSCLIGAALLASVVPARRAARVDPATTMRCE